MNKFWKWFLIVLGVLVALGVIALVVFGVTHGFNRAEFPGGRTGGFGAFPRGGMDGFHKVPGRTGAFGMMPGMMAFGFLFSILRLAIPLGLIALVVWAVVKLTSKKKIVPVGELSPPESNIDPAAATNMACPHCGKPIMADWVTCPYCSEKL